MIFACDELTMTLLMKNIRNVRFSHSSVYSSFVFTMWLLEMNHNAIDRKQRIRNNILSNDFYSSNLVMTNSMKWQRYRYICRETSRKKTKEKKKRYTRSKWADLSKYMKREKTSMRSDLRWMTLASSYWLVSIQRIHDGFIENICWQQSTSFPS